MGRGASLYKHDANTRSRQDFTLLEQRLEDLLGYVPVIGESTGWDPKTRTDYGLCVTEAAVISRQNIELSALSVSDLPILEAYLASPAASVDLSPFQHVSVHGPAKQLPGGVEGWELLLERLSALPRRYTKRIIMHPDTLPPLDSLQLQGFSELGERLVLENMDCRKTSCRTAAELKPVFEQLPEARFCFDVAHAFTVDATQEEGQRLLEAFSDRLCEVHVSGIEPSGKHRPTTAEDLIRYRPLLDQCKEVPWVLESPLELSAGIDAPETSS